MSVSSFIELFTEQQKTLQALTLERCNNLLDQTKSLLILTIEQSNRIHDEFVKNMLQINKREREEEEEDEEFIGSEDIMEEFKADAHLDIIHFVRLYKEARFDFLKAVNASPWARKHFLAPLEGIRNNLGRGGDKQKEAFDELFLIQDYVTEVVWDEEEEDGPKMKTCILCYCKKKCPHTLYINGEACPVADNCAHLADSVIQFARRLNELAKGESKDYDSLDTLFGQIMQSHADKKKKRKTK